MPRRYRLCIDGSRLLAIVRFTGEVTGRDLAEAAARLHAHAAWDARCDVIWDYRAIETFVIQPDEVAGIFEARTRNSVGRDAILVKRDLEYMIARLYAHRAQEVGKEVRLCWHMDEVLAHALVRQPVAITWKEERPAKTAPAVAADESGVVAH